VEIIFLSLQPSAVSLTLHIHIYVVCPRKKVNILAVHSIGRSKQKYVYIYVFYSEQFAEIGLFHCRVYCADEQNVFDVDGGTFENILY
jgi:hypothetical protein